MPEQMWNVMKTSKSFKNKDSRQISPCHTPSRQWKKLDWVPLNDIQDLIPWSILKTKRKNFPLMLFFNNFDHNPTLQTESNALLKITKEQISFNFSTFKSLIIALNTNILSLVEYHTRFSLNTSCSIKLFNLRFSTALNSFPKQPRYIIGWFFSGWRRSSFFFVNWWCIQFIIQAGCSFKYQMEKGSV